MPDEKINIPPRTLYRFRSNLADHSLEDELDRAINKHQVWCSSVETQNDPFDGTPYITESSRDELVEYVKKIRAAFGDDISVSGKSLRELAIKNGVSEIDDIDRWLSPELYDDNFKENVSKRFMSIRNLIKIACFSETLNSILMWSHYANGHKGVCLEYDAKAVTTGAYSRSKLFRVEYADTRPKTSQIEILLFLAHYGVGDRTSITKKQLADFLSRTSLTKSSQWSYEREWRWAKYDEKDACYQIMLPMKVTSITVGVNADTDTIDLCKRVAERGLGIPVYKAKLSDSDFTIIRERA